MDIQVNTILDNSYYYPKVIPRICPFISEVDRATAARAIIGLRYMKYIVDARHKYGVNGTSKLCTRYFQTLEKVCSIQECSYPSSK